MKVVCCLLSVVCCLLSVEQINAQGTSPPSEFEFIPHVNKVAGEQEFDNGDWLRSKMHARNVTNTYEIPLYLFFEVSITTAPEGNPPTATRVAYSQSAILVYPGETITESCSAEFHVPATQPPASLFYTGSAAVFWSTTDTMQPDRSNVLATLGGGNHKYHRPGQGGGTQ